MLQLSDQDTLPLFKGGREGGWQNNYIYTTIEFGGLDFDGWAPLNAPLPCHVEHDRHVCVYGLFIYLFACSVYTIGRP